MGTDFNKLIDEIAKNVSDLSSKKNINEITKLRNENDEKIKNAVIKLRKIKLQIESDDIEINKNMTDDEYESISQSITENEMEKIQNITNLEIKIQEFKKIAAKIKSCIHFINNKKMTIVECDNNMKQCEKIKDSISEKELSDSDNESNKSPPKKLATKKKKENVASLSSNSEDELPLKKSIAKKKKVAISSESDDSDIKLPKKHINKKKKVIATQSDSDEN
jgi:hypothetical protein